MISKCWDNEKQVPLEELIEGFHPEENDIDAKLLYFITGRELNDCMIEWRRSDFNEYGDNYLLEEDDDDPGDCTAQTPFTQSLFSNNNK